MIQPRTVYTSADLEGLPHLDTLPGVAPFVRGVHRTMYAGKAWTIRQYAGFADATASNLAFRKALAQGAQGLSVAFDLPTHRGYDSDHPMARADVGMAGVAIDSVDDMKRLFDGIALDRISVSMTMSGAVLPVLAAFLVAGEESGVPLGMLSGTIQNDILKEFMVRNTWIFAPGPSMHIAGDVVTWLARHAPRFNGMSISGYHFQEAGADAALELALTLANGRAYVDAIRDRGVDVDDFGGGLSFFFGVGKNFFTEIAKLRAARLLWWELMTQAGATTARAASLRMHCQTSGWSLTARQPRNNIVRTTVEAMAAVFGGTQSLHTNAFDEALALPGAEATRLARDTQHILQHEMGLCAVADPWAGSYMMESLTHEIAAHTRSLMAKIAACGGVLAALESGWVHRRIADAAARIQARIDAGDQAIVGVNRFSDAMSDDDDAPACFAVDGHAIQAAQAHRLAQLRASRDREAVTHALGALTAAAHNRHTGHGDGGNLLALAIDAMRCRATVGECTRALEAVWPRHEASPVFAHGQYADARPMGDRAWSTATARVDALATRLGRAPRVLVAKLGLDGHDRGAKAVAAALGDAGFAVTLGALFRQPEDVAAEAVDASFDAVGVSTLAGAHMDLLSRFLDAIRAHGALMPVFAGGIVPEEHGRTLRALGIHDVFGPGTRMEEIVTSIVTAIETSIEVEARQADEV